MNDVVPNAYWPVTRSGSFAPPQGMWKLQMGKAYWSVSAAEKWQFGVAGAVLVLIVPLWRPAWLFFSIIGCGIGNGAAAERMRVLDDIALERLYRETESLIVAQRRKNSLDFVVQADELPPSAREIDASYATIYGNDASFMLSGCYDDKVFLNVTVANSDRQAEISLSPGETKSIEVLWPKRTPGPSR